MGLLIKNGEIINADSRVKADIYIENETITQIGKNLDTPKGIEIIDAEGKYVFPGFIDPHVHIHLPFMGTATKDTHTTGSIAALAGGTTSFIEMCVPNRNEEPLDGYELWKSKAEGSSACDFTFHMGVAKYDTSTEAQLKKIINDGIASFKIFLAYKNFFGINDTELWNTLTFAKKNGIITTAHCENETLVAELQQKLLAEGKTGPGYHEPSRPPWVEAEGVNHFASFLEMTGAHGYVVHTSSEAALRKALEAKERGVNIWVETLIQYLLLDKTYAEKGNFEGAKYVMSPPLRGRENQKVFWDGLKNNLVDTVATDHAPFDFNGQKDMGRDDFTKIPNGIPAIEDRINLLYTYGVAHGRMDIHRFVDAASTRVAKLFGMFPRKGTVQVGSDADLVIYDPEYRGKISADTQHMNVDYSAFEGVPIEGKPSAVTVRGKISFKDGKFVGETTWGRLVRREATHY